MPGEEEEGQGPYVIFQEFKGIRDALEKSEQWFMFYKYISSKRRWIGIGKDTTYFLLTDV